MKGLREIPFEGNAARVRRDVSGSKNKQSSSKRAGLAAAIWEPGRPGGLPWPLRVFAPLFAKKWQTVNYKLYPYSALLAESFLKKLLNKSPEAKLFA